jgi:hypothetical protein
MGARIDRTERDADGKITSNRVGKGDGSNPAVLSDRMLHRHRGLRSRSQLRPQPASRPRLISSQVSTRRPIYRCWERAAPLWMPGAGQAMAQMVRRLRCGRVVTRVSSKSCLPGCPSRAERPMRMSIRRELSKTAPCRFATSAILDHALSTRLRRRSPTRLPAATASPAVLLVRTAYKRAWSAMAVSPSGEAARAQ